MSTDERPEERLYAAFLAARSANGVTFGAWVESQPDHASELRQMHAESEALRGQASFFRQERTTVRAEPRGLVAGLTISDYELVGLVGEGGMGQVWEARQLSLGGRSVALKFVRANLFTPRSLKLFKREARAGGRLNHPGLVSVLDSGETTGIPWIAMEFVPGGHNLQDAIGRFALDELPSDYDQLVAKLTVQIADAMQSAHDAGVIHRDLKPANILITEDDQTKIMDFGLARIADEAALSLTGELGGTYYYMSPEQVAAKRMPVDARSDIFSLGAVLYEMLTLQRPFQGDTTHQVVEQVLLKEPLDPRRIRSRVSVDLVWICTKALEKDRDRRYPSMMAFAADLRAFLADQPISARRPSLLARAKSWQRRHIAATAAMSVLAVAVVLVTSLLAVLARTNESLEKEQGRIGRLLSEQEQMNAELRRTNSEVEEAAERNGRQAEQILRLTSLQDVGDLVAEADTLWPANPDRIEELYDWISRATEIARSLPEHRRVHAELLVRLAELDETESDDAHRLRAHLKLLDVLIASIEQLERPEDGLFSAHGISPVHGWSIPRRLKMAETLFDAIERGEAHEQEWARALPAIALAYPDLQLTEQMGLVPLRADPESGLWEFWHVQSGARPGVAADGSYGIREATGLVLVLVPAGSFTMGSKSKVGRPGYDSLAEADELPAHAVELSAFFLSKFEMTQMQWIRMSGKNPSYYHSQITSLGEKYGLVHPVEQISWEMCDEWLMRLGLELPTEAQWEYAARGGTSTVWLTGNDAAGLLNAKMVNFADVHAHEAGWAASIADLDDGFMAHAPIGSFLPNPFGFHDMFGNVYEFCLDDYQVSFYHHSPSLDPVARTDGEYHVMRGGSFMRTQVHLRSAARYGAPAGFLNYDSGVRPARSID